MNQQQRDFLVKTISDNANKKINEIDSQIRKLEKPTMSGYAIKHLQSGLLKVKPEADILKLAFKALTTETGWRDADGNDNEKWARLVFEEPEAYTIEKVKYHDQYNALEALKNEFISKRDTLIMRVKLAPAKRLDLLISQIDDMGDIDLMDTRLMLLSQSEIKALE